jgi:hypothetical protein
LTLLDGGQAELNRGSGKSPSFLWYYDGAGRGDPIVELLIEYEESIEHPGYEKLGRNILKGMAQGAYIYFKRGVDVDPIGELRLLYDSTTPGQFLFVIVFCWLRII